MEIVCQSCQGKFKIADGKVPAGKTATLKCPRCNSTIRITAKEEAPPETDAAFDDLFEFEEDEGEGYDAAEKPFDFIEEEGKTALVCESDAIIREKMLFSME